MYVCMFYAHTPHTQNHTDIYADTYIYTHIHMYARVFVCVYHSSVHTYRNKVNLTVSYVYDLGEEIHSGIIPSQVYWKKLNI